MLPYRVRETIRLGFILLVITTLTRVVLALYSYAVIDWNLSVPAAFVLGLGFDILNILYYLAVVFLLLSLIPNGILRRRFGWLIPTGLMAVFIFLGYFTAVAEWVFWEEFGVRFNFIAVDYLVYTQEVLDNIVESYPIPLIFAALGFITFATVWPVAAAAIRSHSSGKFERPVHRFSMVVVLIAGIALAEWGVDQNDLPFFKDNYTRELAKNGTYSLFSAFWKNELDFQEFYPTIDEATLDRDVRGEMSHSTSNFTSTQPGDWIRQFGDGGDEERWNIVQITVESLSASYIEAWGSTDNLTPNLDAIIPESYVLHNLYATGTRTVRGLEALTSLLPPTPGRSLVKRGYGERVPTLANVFKKRGYELSFLYGGNGYFDNMNAYFSAHGFKIIDQPRKRDEEITFKNAWGVCDEDLYNWALEEADANWAKGKPFYEFMMTTSNHRPYTYPEGKISIPSGTGRNGAVAYTDYAIGAFLEKARTRPWFAHTVFLIVADHCSGSARKSELDVSKYRIPVIYYAPGLISPGSLDTLGSQIDVLPTLLGLMNWTYEGAWFGEDLATVSPENGRAYIGNYQKLGRLANSTLTVLGPQSAPHSYIWDPSTNDQTLTNNPHVVEESEFTIATYQGADKILNQYKK